MGRWRLGLRWLRRGSGFGLCSLPGPKSETWGTRFRGGLRREGAEELLEEVGGYGGAVAGGGADVVDGVGFGGEGGAGLAEGGGEVGGG
jgi:hypothetical protein